MGSNTSLMRQLENCAASLIPGAGSLPFELRFAVYRRYFYSSKYRFAYLRIPKSANSTVVMTLCEAMARHEGSVLDLGRGFDGSQMAKKMAKQGFYPFIVNELRGAATFRFTFVRNPFTRILSAYLDKIAQPQAVFLGDLGIEQQRPLTFLEFLQRLDQGFLNANAHWAPQAVMFNPATFDFIGRVETLERGMAHVLEHVFGTAGAPLATKEAGRRNTVDLLTQYYGEAECCLVQKLYAADFDRFFPNPHEVFGT